MAKVCNKIPRANIKGENSPCRLRRHRATRLFRARFQRNHLRKGLKLDTSFPAFQSSKVSTFSGSHGIRHSDGTLNASIRGRWIAVDQPSVGEPSPKKDRRMVNWGTDMEDLADDLGFDIFNVACHWAYLRFWLQRQSMLAIRLGQICLTFGSELNDAICRFIEVLAVDWVKDQ